MSKTNDVKGRPHRSVSPARAAALSLLRESRERKAFATELVSSRIDSFGLSPEDKAFATKLVLGVVSTQGTLDEQIDRYVKSPQELQPEVRDALRISTYEILFLDKSPHAAVDQGVELVRSVTHKAAGLANAVLRKIVQARKDFPFGDPRKNDAALAREQAFPLWLASQLIEEMGRDHAEKLMVASNLEAPLFVAVNAVKAEDAEIIACFKQEGIDLRQVGYHGTPIPGCYFVNQAKTVNLPSIRELFSEGKLLVSDAASQMIAYFVLPETYPESFLEIGSGRGTKTVLLQSNAVRKYGKQMKLTALDSHAFKADLLKKRAKEYGVQIDKVVAHDATKLSEVFADKSFESIFIDAPCSGLGTLRRHPEIRWRLKQENIASLAQLGNRMVKAAAPCVTLGGSLTYATCTVTQAENEKVIKEFLSSPSGTDFTMGTIGGGEVFKTVFDSGTSDAHFAVRLVRTK